MLGARIAALRKAAGMSQAQLARELGISTSAVGMYEQGRREPQVGLLTKMADIFGVSTDFLINGQPESIQDQQVIGQALMDRVSVTDMRLESRSSRPFSRQELAVLFAAMLMES